MLLAPRETRRIDKSGHLVGRIYIFPYFIADTYVCDEAHDTSYDGHHQRRVCHAFNVHTNQKGIIPSRIGKLVRRDASAPLVLNGSQHPSFQSHANSSAL